MKLSQTNGPLFAYYDTVYETLAHLKRCGFRYVDLSFWSRFLPGSRYFTEDLSVLAAEYRDALERLELIPVQSHEPMGNSLGDDGGAFYMKKTPRSIELAGKIGIPSITIHAGWNINPMSREEFMDETARIIRGLLPYAEPYGTHLLVENTDCTHDGIHLATADDLLELLERVNHPLVGACWDVGHANLCGCNQYENIKKLGKALGGVHLHDNLGMRAPNCDMHIFPMWGNVNYDAVMTALLEIGYSGTFNFEMDAPARRSGIPFEKDGVPCEALAQLTPQLREMSDALLYNIGKHILQTYECFEE